MQASRSNIASDLQKVDGLQRSDRQPDLNVPRSLPSPFSAPIQAARKYLERQRNDGLKRDLREGAHAERGTFSTTDAEESSRERDRRLERSLYEGHSIEAGLSFEGLPASEATVVSGHASLAESDGSEPLFSYAAAEPVPDPEIVRGAIGRLARTLQPTEEASRELSRKLAVEPMRSREWGMARSSSDGGNGALREVTAEAEGTPPLAFGDVARRVWSSGFGQAETALRGSFDADGGVAGGWPGAAAQREFDHVREAAAGGVRGTEDPARLTRAQAISDEVISLHEVSRQVIRLEEVSLQGVGLQGVGLQGVGEQGIAERVENRPGPRRLRAADAAGSAAMDPVTHGSSSSHGSSSLPGLREKPQDVAEGDAALAHDACNLLSALALYSELLGSPGVLVEPYRHYAGDLKLLACRSQVLIDRLLLAAALTRKKAAAVELEGSMAVHAGHRGRDAAEGSPDLAAHSSAGLQTGSVLQQPAESTSATASADSKGGPDGRSGETESTSLADLLLRWGGLLSTLAHGTLDVVLGPQAATPVPASAEAVERILVNLVRNARAATAEGGAIRIGAGLAEAAMSEKELDRQEEVPEGVRKFEGFEGVDTAVRATAAGASPAEVRGAVAQSTMVLTVDDSGCGMTAEQIGQILNAGEVAGPEPSPTIQEKVVSEGYGAWQEAAAAGVRRDSQGLGSPDGSHSRPEASSGRSLPGPATAEGEGRRQGLGLQVVRGLVASSGGRLSIESQPGRGTRIEIRWPVAAASAGSSAAGAAADDSGETLERVRTGSPEPSTAPIAALAAVPDTAPVELRGAVGPDGFSEMELRSMMLRLHRNGPPQRGQDRVRERTPERSPLGRRLNYRSAAMGDPGHGFGLAGSGVPALAGQDKGQGHGAQDVAAKGAIAC